MPLPKIVTTRLAALHSCEHPDADLLTAFAEHTLGGSERELVLSHLSGCRQCRQVIAWALPESRTEALSAPVASLRDSWLRMPVLRWGALAACLVVVAAVALMQKREESSHREVQVALKVTPPPAAATQASNPMPSVPEGMVSRSEMKAKSRSSPAPSKQTMAQQLAANVPAPPPNAPSSVSTAAADHMSASETVEIQAASPALEPKPPEKPNQSLSARNSVAAAKVAPLFTARPSTETAASTIGGVAKLTDFRAPDWRLSHDGLPERSFASGQWEKVQVDHKTGFHAIAARDMDVWVGGPGGLLYRSQDMGLHWTRIIPVSSNATLSDDITGIDFTDPRHCKLRTSGGRTWVTADAGVTWEIQQP
jgi:Putative zinc-finger